MFTIKHITPMGNEALYPAVEVTYSAYAAPMLNEPPFQALTGSVWYVPSLEPGQCSIELRSGTVYVMNDAGSTVAKYDLGGWAYPEQKAAA
jgi:hypothetical protein